MLTSKAFETVFTWFPYVLAVAVLLFAFSTMITWSYYGLKAWTFLFGESKTNGDHLQAAVLFGDCHWLDHEPVGNREFLRCGQFLNGDPQPDWRLCPGPCCPAMPDLVYRQG